jgi:ketosteroid isomerase-like protein
MLSAAATRRADVQTLTGIILAGATMVLVATADSQTRAPGERAADVAAIRAHIESIFQAFIDKDLSKLNETHGADWRGFMPGSGRVIRRLDGYMDSATYSATLPKGQGTVGYRISDFDVVFYGDTAVASFVTDVDIVSDTDKTTQKLTLMDVYHKEPTGWSQVASDTSLHPEESERQMSRFRPLTSKERAPVLAARDAVWRAWYAGDTAALARLVPAELITLESDAGAFGTRESILASSRRFAATGATLTRLAFPRTEFQAYGATVILYTSYEMDIMHEGQTRTERGAATEVFVLQNDQWLNTGWQVAPAQSR